MDQELNELNDKQQRLLLQAQSLQESNCTAEPTTTTTTPEKEKPPQTLQELVAGNVLIDAFMGITSASASPSVHNTVTHTEDSRESDMDKTRLDRPVVAAVEEDILGTIESCTDIELLVQEIQRDLRELVENYWSVEKSEQVPTTQESLVNETNDATVNADVEYGPDYRFLAARLARIKSLLYNERSTSSSATSSTSLSSYNPLFFLNLSSQQQQQQQYKTNASALVHSLLLDSKRKEIMITLLEYLNELPFETRKDVSSIFNYLLVCGCVLDGQEEQTFGNGAGNDRWMMISSLSSSQQANYDDAVSLSYVQTMLQFVEYVNEYYGPIMKHIVEGHYVAGTIQNSGDGANASGYGTTKAASSIKTVDVALHCGTMLRSTLRHAKLYANLIQPLHTANFVYPFLNVFVNQPNFEVASDALETLRLILHPNINAIAVPSFATTSLDVVQVRESLEAMMESTAAMFLEREYEAIFVQRFNVLLLSAEHANYITRRVSLQILSAVLLTRSNYNVMIRYVSSRSNLKTIMMLLSDSSAHITLEAFHVFKIFVANPNKPMEIVRILADNKVKLVKYLTGLHREKEVTDDQFRDEKALVITTLQEIDYNPSDGS